MGDKAPFARDELTDLYHVLHANYDSIREDYREIREEAWWWQKKGLFRDYVANLLQRNKSLEGYLKRPGKLAKSIGALFELADREDIDALRNAYHRAILSYAQTYPDRIPLATQVSGKYGGSEQAVLKVVDEAIEKGYLSSFPNKVRLTETGRKLADIIENIEAAVK